MSPKPFAPAATVVLIRPDSTGQASEICVVRRSSKSAFMPDTYVFPGGRVDPDDGPIGSDESFERAARRECQEEVNLALPGEALRWFDTWLTPSGEGPRRFLARFYLAHIHREQSKLARADGIETHAERWESPQTLLEEAKRGSILLAPPTWCVLFDLIRVGPAGLEARSNHELQQPILPKAQATKHGTMEVIMPHDPIYATLDGDSLPPPRRVIAHPLRFIRQDRGWLPVDAGI